MNKASVYLDGSLIGFHEEPEEVAEEIRGKRRRGELPKTLTVSNYDNSVYINTDKGRAIRPLIIAEDGKPKLTEEHIEKVKKDEMSFEDLFKNGIIEYLDAEEEENAYIAMEEEELTEEHTHLEIHPTLSLGIPSAVNPYPEHSHSVRTAKGDSMMRQAMGLYSPTTNIRTDTQGYYLFYPQKPLTGTKYDEKAGLTKRPIGQNFVVAIMPYRAYNIDDAIILNKGSVERALSRGSYLRTYSSKERRYAAGQRDRFEIPTEEVQGYRGEEEYTHLGEDGIANPETEVEAGGVLIGKTSPPRFLEETSELTPMEEKRKEDSKTTRPNAAGKVDWVMATEDENGSRLVKVRTRKTMPPLVGDKFAARSGQKGVVGLIEDEEDLPWSENGIQPDMIFNSHAVPSRMTVGHLLEAIGSKKASIEGEKTDGTAFEGEPKEKLEETLEKHGFRPTGKEIMYDGKTGRRIEAKIFVGVVYYKRLEHLVSKKIRARSTGPVQILTRQPTEGRSRKGGLRIGVMERDCLISHGASMLLQERLMDESDETIQYVCESCGSIAVKNQIKGETYCESCGSKEVEKVKMSYTFKLLLNELKSIGIKPKLGLRDKA